MSKLENGFSNVNLKSDPSPDKGNWVNSGQQKDKPVAKFRKGAGRCFGSACCQLFLFGFYIPFLMALDTAMIVIGVLYKDQCPLEPKVPIMLAVCGVCLLLMSYCKMALRIRLICKKEDSKPLIDYIFGGLFGFFFIINIALTIAFGTIILPKWTHDLEDDVTSLNYCSPIVFIFSLKTVIAHGIGFALILLIALSCFTCCGAKIGAGGKSSKTADLADSPKKYEGSVGPAAADTD